MDSLQLTQFAGCLQTLFESPPVGWNAWVAEVLAHSERRKIADTWLKSFQDDLFSSKRGYPLVPVRTEPDLEDSLLYWGLDWGLVALPKGRATICLTHDVDYLDVTLPLRFKWAVGYRRILRRSGGRYLDSLRSLLEADERIAERRGVASVFVASPFRSSKFGQRLAQWLIDPSYTSKDPLFAELRQLLKEFDCEIGLHGSFFSLRDGQLGSERQALACAMDTDIRCGRQHWLNLPGSNALEAILKSGIVIDSSLGWNGVVGFRGGMSRLYPIHTHAGKLWEIPMLLMDGPLFEDLKLDTDAVVAKSISMLDMVFERKGSVAINWHERAAHPSYAWFEAYRRILDYAGERGFHFATMAEVLPEQNGNG